MDIYRKKSEYSPNYIIAILDQIYLWLTRPKNRENIEIYMIKTLDVPLSVLWHFKHLKNYGLVKFRLTTLQGKREKVRGPL